MRSAVAAFLLVGFLCGCAGGVKASVRSPVAQAPKFQSPISIGADASCGPVYKPPVPHIDTGDDPCPGGVCRVPGATPKLPGHDQGQPAPTTTTNGSPVAGLVLSAIVLLAVTLVFVFRP